MARKRRRRIDATSPLAQGTPVWRWRTLPVWIALNGGFILGWYVAAIGSDFRPAEWSFYALITAISLFSLGLSRMFGRRFIEPWAARRRAARQQKRILSSPTSRRGGPG